MSFRTALFDLDGTILDTLDDLFDATNATLAKFGMPPRTRMEVRSFVGHGIANLITTSAPAGTDPALVQEMIAYFKEYYGAHCADKTCPFEGVLEMLRALRAKGIRTAVISNKGDFAVQELAKRYFDGLFDFVLGEKEPLPRKPAPDMVEYALKQMGVTSEGAVYIGDSDADVLTAKNAALPCITVTWGFRDRDFLKQFGADVIVDRVSDLQDLLLAP